MVMVQTQKIGKMIISRHPPELKDLIIELQRFHKPLIAELKAERLFDPIPDQENVPNVLKQLCTHLGIVLDGLYDDVDMLVLCKMCTKKLYDRRILNVIPVHIGPTDV